MRNIYIYSKEYELPVIEVVKFDSDDLIVNLASSSFPITTTEHDVEIDYW